MANHFFIFTFFILLSLSSFSSLTLSKCTDSFLQLAPCFEYLRQSTSLPPDRTCCEVIFSTVRENPYCLCDINNTLYEKYNLNMTKTAGDCHVNVPLQCQVGDSPKTPTRPMIPPTPVIPPTPKTPPTLKTPPMPMNPPTPKTPSMPNAPPTQMTPPTPETPPMTGISATPPTPATPLKAPAPSKIALMPNPSPVYSPMPSLPFARANSPAPSAIFQRPVAAPQHTVEGRAVPTVSPSAPTSGNATSGSVKLSLSFVALVLTAIIYVLF